MRSSLVSFLTIFLVGTVHALAMHTEVAKRTTGTASFYNVGNGTCGVVSKATDFVTAIAVPYYNGGASCFKTVTITAYGKTTTAQVVDECPECSYSSLDFSIALFEFFAPLGVGSIDIIWSFT
ncbi:hypothetical protein BV25DRAFT_591108 [Artomyces pyxidatus]|uniref:Uncharacterized protein n=1 Tax=Artomyces pyxidatus TaxID=48021 RepID=A0ACB8T3E1_9AGAM|nr:hypothetical protein BV25DRAFT_591108 [Artomyces pyxidatus]